MYIQCCAAAGVAAAATIHVYAYVFMTLMYRLVCTDIEYVYVCLFLGLVCVDLLMGLPVEDLFVLFAQLPGRPGDSLLETPAVRTAAASVSSWCSFSFCCRCC